MYNNIKNIDRIIKESIYKVLLCEDKRGDQARERCLIEIIKHFTITNPLGDVSRVRLDEGDEISIDFIKNEENPIVVSCLRRDENDNIYEEDGILKGRIKASIINRKTGKNEPINLGWLNRHFHHIDNEKDYTSLYYMYDQFMQRFFHNPKMRSSAILRLAPLFCKIAFRSNFQNSNPDNKLLNRLRNLIKLLYVMDITKKEIKYGIKSPSEWKFNEININDFDLNNIPLNDKNFEYNALNGNFGAIIDRFKNDLKTKVNNSYSIESTNPESKSRKYGQYTVIGPLSYEESKQIGNYSCFDSKVCYTQQLNTWEDWTNDGENNVYVMLKDGWRRQPEMHDNENNSPYDAYGLSMIFVGVDPDGDLLFCNTRWNHNARYDDINYGCDDALDELQISKLLGVNFYSVFKPKQDLVYVSESKMKNIIKKAITETVKLKLRQDNKKNTHTLNM